MASGKMKKMKQRLEPVNTTEGTDFSVVNTANRVTIRELVSSLKDRKAHADLKKVERFSKRAKPNVLPVPLAKHEEQKIKRSIIYEQVNEEVTKWDNVVRHNRLAEHIDYPLEAPDLRMLTAMETAEKYTPKTSLELQIASILEGSKNVITDTCMLTKAEEEALKAMDLEEAMQRRNEVIKMRALQSYLEAKAHRKKKIKSKQYHRLLKKERINKQRKEYEQLMQNDPNAAADKLDRLDKQRIEERMTLKHRGTGQWAKQLQTRAKYDKNARISLGEQLQINRQLVQKVRDDEESENEEEMKRDLLDEDVHFDDEESPWLAWEKPKENEEEVEDEIEESYKKVWSEVREDVERLKAGKGEKAKKKAKKAAVFEENTQKKSEKVEFSEEKAQKKSKKVGFFEEEAQKIVDEAIRKRKRGSDEAGKRKRGKRAKRKNKKGEWKITEQRKEPETEENKMEEGKILIEKGGRKVISPKDGNIETDFDKMDAPDARAGGFGSEVSEMIARGDDMDDAEVDEEEEHRMTLAEAFADDDVTSAFQEQKEAAIKKDQPDDIDLFLPGWGHWGGAGVKENERLKKKFTIEAPKLKRKDRKLNNVILKEDKDKKLAKLQVSSVPFPFGNAYYFEKSLQAPLGKDWNTESGFRQLVAPKVSTKVGAIIEPINKDVLVDVRKGAPRRREVGGDANKK